MIVKGASRRAVQLGSRYSGRSSQSSEAIQAEMGAAMPTGDNDVFHSYGRGGGFAYVRYIVMIGTFALVLIRLLLSCLMYGYSCSLSSMGT